MSTDFHRSETNCLIFLICIYACESVASKRRRRDGMRPSDELRSRLSWLRASNAEFAHPVVQRSAVQTEARGGSRGAANHPTRFAQHAKNVIALDGFECGGSVSWRFG